MASPFRFVAVSMAAVLATVALVVMFSSSDDATNAAADVATTSLAAAVGYNPTSFTRASLGSALKHTLGQEVTLPITTTAAKAAGWKAVSGKCESGVGIRYTQSAGITKDTPLFAFFTKAGQIAGVGATLWGNGPQSGNALQVKMGFLKTLSGRRLLSSGSSKETTYSITVSFRSATDVCSSTKSTEAIGDRLVIDQFPGGIKKEIPLTAAEAKKANFQPGSCMKKMGQHWFYDLQSGGAMTWKGGNILPIVPMYHTTGSNVGKFNAFFFGYPKCQKDSGGAWDNVPLLCGLPNSGMCQNFCSKSCTWDTSSFGGTWATMHMFFNANPSSVKCANPSGVMGALMGRDCPANTGCTSC